MSTHALAPDPGRATDADRDSAVERLRAAVGQGLLDLDEFDRRAIRAFEADTVAELFWLTGDLSTAPGGVPGRAEPLVARFGPIEVSPSTVRTPEGACALRGTVWRTFDHWYHRRVTPGWAVALAVAGFFVVPFVSLLFLLVKESRADGVVQVVVREGVRQHVVDIPVTSPAHARALVRQVGYVDSLARGR